MISSDKEKQTLRSAEKALDSDNIEDVKSHLLDLLNLYQKISRRHDKILKQSDRQQESLLSLTYKLHKIKEQQAQNIAHMIDDQKKRAKNILESKRKIYENHQQELESYKTSVNDLTQLLLDKETLSVRYEQLKKDYQQLRTLYYGTTGTIKETLEQYHISDLEDILTEFEEDQLEEVLYAITLEFVQTSLIETPLNPLHFPKIFFKSFKELLINHFLVNQHLNIPADVIAMYVIKKYMEDLLSILADQVLQKIAQHSKNAELFFQFFNGEIIVDTEGKKVIKSAIIDSATGMLWMSSVVAQIVAQRKTVQNQIQAKLLMINKIEDKLASLTSDDPEKLNYQKILDTENGRLIVLQEIINPLDQKYDAIITEFVRAIMKFMSQGSS